MPPYKEDFLRGTPVRIVELTVLEQFRKDWKYHNPLSGRQLQFAGQIATVTDVSFYHGGDVLYSLKGVPGIWHECCLQKAP